MKNNLLTLLVGIWFGVILTKGQVLSWHKINDMFYFREPYMYQVIISAIVVAALSVFLLKRFQVRTIEGTHIVTNKKTFHNGTVIGGTIFGMGWAITGACPGPIYAQMGAGTLLAVVTFIGAITGMYIYAALEPNLPHNDWYGFGRRAGRAGSSS